jgi:hypothetical protein
MTDHGIMLARAQALQDDSALAVVLCDLTLGRAPDQRDLSRLAPALAAGLVELTAPQARKKLESLLGRRA